MDADTVASKAKGAVNTGADVVEGAIDDVAAKATSLTRKTKVATVEAIDGGRDAVAEALSTATEIIRARPITSVAVVGLIAYIWGRIK